MDAGRSDSADSDEASGSEARVLRSATSWHRLGNVCASVDGGNKPHHSQTSIPPEILKADFARAREDIERLVTKSTPAIPTNVQSLQVHRRLGFLLQGKFLQQLVS